MINFKTSLVVGVLIFSMLPHSVYALDTSPAPDGKPVEIAQRVIWDNFEKSDCPKVTSAKRVQDGSITAKCSNGERFRIFVVDQLNQPVALRCSAAEKMGIAGC